MRETNLGAVLVEQRRRLQRGLAGAHDRDVPAVEAGEVAAHRRVAHELGGQRVEGPRNLK